MKSMIMTVIGIFNRLEKEQAGNVLMSIIIRVTTF